MAKFDFDNKRVLLNSGYYMPINGIGKPDHIFENTKLYHFELTEEEMDAIHALNKNEKHDWY